MSNNKLSLPESDLLLHKIQQIAERFGHGSSQQQTAFEGLRQISELINRSFPIDMLLFCPNCGKQHIDKVKPEQNWDNPAHRSHRCDFCTHIWRPADIFTNGVESINTKGQADGSAVPQLSEKLQRLEASLMDKIDRETVLTMLNYEMGDLAIGMKPPVLCQNFLAILFAEMLQDAPNFVTSTMTIKTDKYEFTIRRKMSR